MAIALANALPLRHVVLVDGIVSGAMGALLIVASGPLSGLLGFPADFLFWVGVALLPWMAALVVLGRREPVSRPGVETVIALNALWVLGSIAVLVGGFFEPTALGIAFVIAQGAAVALFAEFQFIGLRRAG